MATTVDARAIAGALYDSLIGTALEQLQSAVSKLAGTVGGDVTQRIDAALPAGALPQVRNFLLSLASEGLIDQAGEIVTVFGTFMAGPPARALDALVTSAVALSAEQQNTITTDLRKRYGDDTKVAFNVDATLIGGLIIRIGDQVLDNSLRTRLSAVQRNMLSS